MRRRVWMAVVIVVLMFLSSGAWLASATAQTGGPGGFQAADSLPPQDQIAAAPLLVAAYAFVLVALMVYVLLLWRRLAKVESEMHALAKRQGKKAL